MLIWAAICLFQRDAQLSGFSALYIMVSSLANKILDHKIMFLHADDGTPYDIVYNLVGGSPVLYLMAVVALFLLYIAAFYWVYFQVCKRIAKGAGVQA